MSKKQGSKDYMFALLGALIFSIWAYFWPDKTYVIPVGLGMGMYGFFRIIFIVKRMEKALQTLGGTH